MALEAYCARQSHGCLAHRDELIDEPPDVEVSGGARPAAAGVGRAPRARATCV